MSVSSVLSQARPYAKALFHQAVKEQRVKEVLSWLEVLSELVQAPEMTRYLGDPRVSQATIVEGCLEVLENRLNQSDRNFLQILAENKRVSFIPDILAVYSQLQLASLNKVAVSVTTSQTLTEAQGRVLQNSLERKYGGAVDLNYQIDAKETGFANS